MRSFWRNIRKYCISYAIGFVMWDMLEILSERQRTKGLHQIYRIQDHVERFLDKYDNHLQNTSIVLDDDDDEIPIRTPCGCIYFNDCNECSSNSVCNAMIDDQSEWWKEI